MLVKEEEGEEEEDDDDDEEKTCDWHGCTLPEYHKGPCSWCSSLPTARQRRRSAAMDDGMYHWGSATPGKSSQEPARQEPAHQEPACQPSASQKPRARSELAPVMMAKGWQLHLSKLNQTGYKGVYCHGSRFNCSITSGGRKGQPHRYLGTFDTAVDAAVVYARHVQSLASAPAESTSKQTDAAEGCDQTADSAISLGIEAFADMVGDLGLLATGNDDDKCDGKESGEEEGDDDEEEVEEEAGRLEECDGCGRRFFNGGALGKHTWARLKNGGVCPIPRTPPKGEQAAAEMGLEPICTLPDAENDKPGEIARLRSNVAELEDKLADKQRKLAEALAQTRCLEAAHAAQAAQLAEALGLIQSLEAAQAAQAVTAAQPPSQGEPPGTTGSTAADGFTFSDAAAAVASAAARSLQCVERRPADDL